MRTIKRTGFLSLVAITALLLVSCNTDDDIQEANDGKVLFSSGIEGPQLRVGGADGDEWEGDESIGIYMRNNADEAILSNNVEYKAQSAGKTTTFTSTTPIYYPVNTPVKVEFIAYHPHQTPLAGDYGYKVNVATQTSQSAIDLMVAEADNGGTGYDKANTSPVNLKFYHQLAKVVLNVSPGDGVDDLTGLAVSLTGMNTTADFDIATKALTGETDAAAITPFNAGGNAYEAILLPVTTLGTSHVVEFAVDGNTYAWTMSDNDGGITGLVAGNKYTFNVTVQKNKVSVSGTIEAWGNGGTSAVVAN